MQSHEGPAYHAHSGFHSVHEAERADVEDMESSAAGAVAGAASSANEAAVSAETTTFRRTDRSNSQVKFTTQGDSAIEAAMRRELAKLVATAPADERASFEREMNEFYQLFTRYLREKNNENQQLDWNKIRSPTDDQILPYQSLSPMDKSAAKDYLNKLVVLKLNGGLGTTMGCVGPKSAIEVRNGMTFLDLTVRQIEYLNSDYDCDVPLLLMNSFNTDEDTERIIQKYSSHKVNILTFNQSRYPRFGKDSLMPLARSYNADKSLWFPPGHGDVYESLYRTGVLDALLRQGKEYIFVSNVDNLGATVDLAILSHMVESKSEFLMEVTNKTRSDIKGGTLINYEGTMRLLEIAQVPPQHVEDFKSVSKFKIFNTNNLWASLSGIKRVIEARELQLEIIVNPKSLDSGEKVTQLETASGAAIKHFKNGHGINVPRSRFLPVKGTSDLLLVQSDLYSLTHGQLIMNPQRPFPTVPLIKLGKEFSKVGDYLSRFSSIPTILELDHLTITGDVTIGSGVTFKGTVIIVANHGSRIDIPAGSILENKVVSGNLRILDH